MVYMPYMMSSNHHQPVILEKQLGMDDIKIPEGDGPLDPFEYPTSGAYSAVSRGILRVNDDGSHGFQGKWAMTRDHMHGPIYHYVLFFSNSLPHPQHSIVSLVAVTTKVVKLELNNVLYVVNVSKNPNKMIRMETNNDFRL